METVKRIILRNGPAIETELLLQQAPCLLTLGPESCLELAGEGAHASDHVWRHLHASRPPLAKWQNVIDAELGPNSIVKNLAWILT